MRGDSVSVRDLVEFLLRSGSIDNRTPGGSPDTALAGIRMHQKIQEEAQEEGYRAEVPLELIWDYDRQQGGGRDAASLGVCAQEPGADVGNAGTGREDCTADGEGCGEGGKAAGEVVPAHAQEPFCVRVEGRMDGIFRDEERGIWVVDEIKTTYRSLKGLRQPEPLHLAQAKCYAFIWGLQQGGDAGPHGDNAGPQESRVGVRMTYGNLLTERTRRFRYEYSMEELRAWFTDLMEQYRPWAAFCREWTHIRTDSIRAAGFPYPYRPGQKELAAAVYRTIVHGRRLFLEAPTGTGKTLSVLFPAVKAIGEGKADTLFYLTAKTLTRTAAEQSLDLMRSRGLRLKSVTLTAREKLCPLGHPDCNPEGCARAWGHYDRINAAMYDLLIHEDGFTLQAVQRAAEAHQVCPYELSLDMSRYADAVIGDYNYLFDPRAYLRRFFAAEDETADPVNMQKNDPLPFSGPDGTPQRPEFADAASKPAAAAEQQRQKNPGGGSYLFLIDEAHNLVERGRDMYSAVLVREDMLALRRKVKELWPELYRSLGRCSRAMLPLKKEIQEGRTVAAPQETAADLPFGENAGAADEPKAQGRRFPYGDAAAAASGPKRLSAGSFADRCLAPADVSGVLAAAAEVDAELGSVLTKERIAQQSGTAQKDPLRAQKKAVWEEVLDFYYTIEHFIDTAAVMDDHYVTYAQILSDGRFMVKLYCMDPSRRLRACMQRGRAAILFSATLLPITYYKALLGGTAEDYEIYAQSIFDPERMGLFVVRDLTSRYRDRSADNYGRIADCILRVIRQRHGNYLVFFPSYAFLREVEEQMLRHAGTREKEQMPCLPDTREAEVVLLRQRPHMSEAQREAFLGAFADPQQERCLAGLCVAGGIFGEGIDLRGDSLIGVIVVGTGVPQVCLERELLKGHFDSEDGNGYDYAYRYPGMNRVQQAAGRVIRTQEDVGIVVLMDERFAYADYRRLYPREWRGLRVTDSRHIAHEVERFWDEWL